MKPAVYIGLLVLFFVSFMPLYAEVQPSVTVKPNLALADINSLTIVITPSPDEPNTDGLVWSQLIDTVSEKLNKTGIKIIATVNDDILEMPELRLNVELLKINDVSQYAIRVQTSLTRKVMLENIPGGFIKAEVFSSEPVTQTVQIKNMPETIIKIACRQVEDFISAWSVSNQSKAQLTKTTVAKDSKPAKLQRNEVKYVASKNSKVFHKVDCQFANKIKRENLVIYNTRDEAVKAGRNPCKICEP